MIDPKDVSAVLVTRGDVDLTTILHSLPFDDVIVWNNAEREDYACYGRFAAIAEAKHDVIYTQDDDLLVPIAGMLRAYSPDIPGVYANKPPSEEWRFLGCGALFHRSSVNFDAYVSRYGFDADFCRVADVVFAYQNPYRSDWFGYLDFPWQTAPNRMYLQPDHYLVRERARDRTLAFARGENL